MKSLSIFPLENFVPILPRWAGVDGQPYSGIEVYGDEVWRTDDPPTPRVDDDAWPSRDNRISGTITLTAKQIAAVDADLLTDAMMVSLVLRAEHPARPGYETALIIPRASFYLLQPPEMYREYERWPDGRLKIETDGAYIAKYKFEAFSTFTLPWGQKAIEAVQMHRIYAVQYQTSNRLCVDYWRGTRDTFRLSHDCHDNAAMQVFVGGQAVTARTLVESIRLDQPPATDALICAIYSGSVRMPTVEVREADCDDPEAERWREQDQAGANALPVHVLPPKMQVVKSAQLRRSWPILPAPKEDGGESAPAPVNPLSVSADEISRQCAHVLRDGARCCRQAGHVGFHVANGNIEAVQEGA